MVNNNKEIIKFELEMVRDDYIQLKNESPAVYNFLQQIKSKEQDYCKTLDRVKLTSEIAKGYFGGAEDLFTKEQIIIAYKQITQNIMEEARKTVLEKKFDSNSYDLYAKASKATIDLKISELTERNPHQNLIEALQAGMHIKIDMMNGPQKSVEEVKSIIRTLCPKDIDDCKIRDHNRFFNLRFLVISRKGALISCPSEKEFDLSPAVEYLIGDKMMDLPF